MAEFLPPLTFGPGTFDHHHGIDVAALRTERADRARQVMRQHGVATMLVAGPAACRYLTGLNGPQVTPDTWFVLFPAEHDPVVFHHAGYATTMPAVAPWIREWRVARTLLRGIAGFEASAEESRRFAADITAELDRLGLRGEALATVGFGGRFTDALAASGVNVVDGIDVLLESMSIKTPQEILCLRMAGAITDRMWAAMAHAGRAGMTDDELSAVGRQAGRSAGADSVNAVFRSGPLTEERGYKGANQIIVPDDLMIGLVCGTSYLGYRTCVYRTFVVGREPTAEETGWMERLEERLAAVIDELRPGRTTADAARHFPPASSWGYKDEVEVLTIEIGHGIGLHAYEQPVVNRQWSLEHPQEIKEGMVLAVEGREGRPGDRTVRLEQMLVVTADGPRLIDRFHPGITSIG